MKKLFFYMVVCGAMMTALFGFTSCEDELDVQQVYPFTVETMPVPKRLVKGETAEIRCELVREGYFSDTRYTIRYFQPDGEGTLRMDDGMVFMTNDRYPLDRDVFRLYYTSECEDQQTIDIYFEDNHDQLYQLTFTFDNKTDNEENVENEGDGINDENGSDIGDDGSNGNDDDNADDNGNDNNDEGNGDDGNEDDGSTLIPVNDEVYRVVKL